MTATTPQSASFNPFRDINGRIIAAYFLVFIAYFATARVGQYFFYQLHTSPAIIWPPTGIALAAMLLGGYWMWLPIALAQLAASLAGPSSSRKRPSACAMS